jgi:hypothetical protein
MAQYWRLHNPQQDAEFAAAVPNLDAALALEGQRVSGELDSSCRVDVLEFGGKRYFVKHYRALKPSLRHIFDRSKVRTEWDNLLFFRRLQIPTPEPVAIGERRINGVFRAGVLVTAAIPEAIDLAQLAESGNPCLHDRAWFGQLCDGLALPLRRLHDRGFAHNDLNWRNVLLTLAPALRVYFFDCPTGRRWIWPFRQFRIAKDLTHLDKMGRRHLRRSERLRFYLVYAGHARLDRHDKQLLRKVLQRDVSPAYLPPQSTGDSEVLP